MNYLSEEGFTSYAFDLSGHGKRESEGIVGLGIMDYVAEVESSRAIRQMVLPGFKTKAAKITSIPVAVAAAGKDYFFEFQRLQKWAEDYQYDLLSFPEASHNLINEPERYSLGETINKWLHKKVTNN